MKIQYPVRVHKAEEGGYWAEFPDLPGCVTEGDTLKETLDNAREALSGWIASRFERNFEVPTASYQTYQMWENPASANPTIKQLSKVANAVGKKLVLEIA